MSAEVNILHLHRVDQCFGDADGEVSERLLLTLKLFGALSNFLADHPFDAPLLDQKGPLM